jgi:hypothetical protein
MNIYQLRFLFDAGSGVCLWSSNDLAREKFGYPVELNALPLPQLLKERGEALIERFDTSVDWAYPPDPSPWSCVEQVCFEADSNDFLMLLRSYLGDDFEVSNDFSVRD